MSSRVVVTDGLDEMENVELHRAESMVNELPEFLKQDEKPQLRNDDIDPIYMESRCRRFLNVANGMKLEVVVFTYLFAAIMRSISSTTMIMDKVCLVHFEYSHNVCSHLSETYFSAEKSAVEKIANNYHVGLGMIQMLPSATIAVFIGAWSDKYSRKLPVIASLIGIIIDGLGTTLCALFFYSRVEFMFIPAIFTGLTGGMISVLTIVFSYASDVTTLKERTLKYALLELAFGLSIPMGQLAGGWIFKFASYVPVFLVATAVHMFCLGWVLFVLKETKGLDSTDSLKTKLKNLFSLEPVMDSVRATFKKRPNRGKEQILLLTLAMSISVLTFASGASISYFYALHMYGWGNTKFSTISSVFAVIGLVIMFIAVALAKRLRLSEPKMGLIGSASMLAKNLTLGLATHVGVYFLANLLGLLGGIATLAGRTRISKVTSKDDLGKVFALVATAESLLPIIASAVVSQIFNLTLDIYPGIIYLAMGVLMFIPLGVFIWLGTLPTVNYEEMQEKTENNYVESTIIHEPPEVKKVKY